MVARQKLFTYQVTYSIPGISSSKITEKTSGGRHKSSYNIERATTFTAVTKLNKISYLRGILLLSTMSCLCLHPPILLTPFLSEDMNYKRDQGLLKSTKFFL